MMAASPWRVVALWVSAFVLYESGINPLPAPLRVYSKGWTMTAEDREKYEGLFPRYDPDGSGFISGKDAVELLGKSGLERPVLKKVRGLAWFLTSKGGGGVLAVS